MAAPPVPPRPFSDYDDYRRHSSTSPAPAVPPLPPNFDPDAVSPPHFEDPLVAPRPHKLQPDIPSTMARALDEQVASADRYAARPPSSYNPAPGFTMPSARFAPSHPPVSYNASPLPPPQGSDWSPWAAAGPPPATMPQPYSQPYSQPRHGDTLSASFNNLSVADTQRRGHTTSLGATQLPNMSTPSPSIPAMQQGMPPTTPSLTAPLPTIAALSAQLLGLQQLDPRYQVVWCRDVLSIVDRAQQLATPINGTASSSPPAAARISDPELQRLVNAALPVLLRLSSPQQQQQTPMPPHVAEAIYLLATCEASGAYPQFVQHNPRAAFRHYEQTAKAGHYAAWFKLGRDYENFDDEAHAKQCFERGVKYGVESCLYRMGMANLMGQLGLPTSPEAALPLLHRAATLSTLEVPQPAYVFGLLLLNEFSHVAIPPQLFAPYIPPGSSLQAEARKHLERAAYLNFAPAQYKLGHAYEFAMPPFPFDALLSVQYYSLASQQGEVEADMALSKWFLCGSEGAFQKDEGLAWTFAEKAARKGLPNAEFAMGYYSEVGVGGTKDIDAARKWYTRASEHGNTDATERIQALAQPAAQSLSREQHEALTDTTLVRKRTQAKQRSEATRSEPGRMGMEATESQQIVNNVRRDSHLGARVPSGPAADGYGAPPNASPPQMGRPQQLPAVDDTRQHRHTNWASPDGGLGGAPQRPYANAPRYALVDPGSRSASPSRAPNPNPGSTPPLRMQGRQNRPPPGGDAAEQDNAAPPRAPPVKGPQTFEEMGFHSQKLEEKECRIM